VGLQYLSLQQGLYATTALFGVALVIALFVRGRPGFRAPWDVVSPLRQIARGRGFAAALVGVAAATIIWGTLQSYLPVFGKEQLRLPDSQIGYMLAILALSNGLARIPGGRLVDRLPRKGPIIIAGVISFSLCVMVLPHLGGFWAPTIVLAAGVPLLATSYLATSVVFSNLAAAETRGVAMGVYGGMLYLGLGAGPAVFGFVMERSGYVAGFSACAATAIALAVLMAVVRSEPVKRLRGEPLGALPPTSPGT